MCKVHKLIRDVIGEGLRLDGDAYLPHYMTTKLDHDDVVLSMTGKFQSYVLVLQLKQGCGLPDVEFYWSIIRDPHNNDIIGAAVVKPMSTDVHYIDFHTSKTLEEVMHYMKQEHHFQTKIIRM